MSRVREKKMALYTNTTQALPNHVSCPNQPNRLNLVRPRVLVRRGRAELSRSKRMQLPISLVMEVSPGVGRRWERGGVE